jgi:hypothetical protein
MTWCWTDPLPTLALFAGALLGPRASASAAHDMQTLGTSKCRATGESVP